MANHEFYMDAPAVRTIAKRLWDISEVLEGISKALDAAMKVLDATAFIGAVGGAAVARFIEMIKPVIDRAQKNSEELSREVNLAVDAYERGDQLGATKFYS